MRRVFLVVRVLYEFVLSSPAFSLATHQTYLVEEKVELGELGNLFSLADCGRVGYYAISIHRHSRSLKYLSFL